jgi:hypothetical protein
MRPRLFLASAIALLGASALLSTPVLLDAQLFQRTLGGILDDQPQCIESTTDFGYIIAGTQSELILT